MKPKFLLLFIGLLLSASAFAQDSVAVTTEISPDVSARYFVLKSDNKTPNGLYQAFYRKKTPVASGKYDHSKRTGTWHFFDKTGKLMQHFSYAHAAITYEAPEDSATKFKYILDDKFTVSDTLTKPIRIGGRYFGYLPYLNLFRLPKEMISTDPSVVWPSVYMELLGNPGGRLADYRVHVISAAYGERVLEINISHLSDEDKTFAPATINGKNVSSRIIVLCTLNGSRRLVI